MRSAFCPVCSNLVLPGHVACESCGYRFDGKSGGIMSAIEEFGRNVKEAAAPKTVKDENPEAPYLPYEPREMQVDIIRDIVNALEQKRHIVLESGTGTGKTVVSLAATLEFIKRPGNENLKIIYITRTNSQSDQVMKELKAISAIHPVSGITLSGRNRSCINFTSRPDFQSLTPSALSLLCADVKQKANQGKPGGCRYFTTAEQQSAQVLNWARNNFPTSEQFDVHCQNIGVCPYEVRKMIMKDFDVIVAPYIHVLDPGIREGLMGNLGVEEKDIILVVDEAHNLTDHTREMESFTIHVRLISSANDEVQNFKEKRLSERLTISEFIRALRNVIDRFAADYIPFGQKEHLLGPQELEEALCAQLETDRQGLDEILGKLTEVAEKRMEAIADTDDPSSPLSDLSDLLNMWIKSPSDRYVKSIKVNEDGAYVSAMCIDPVEFPAFLRRLPGSVHMSGTLQPIIQYVRTMGLPDNTIPRKYPSPFPKENRMTVYAKDVSTLYTELNKSPAMYEKLQDYIVDLCNCVRKNTMVFVTSYSLMKKLRPAVSPRIMRPIYWEEPGQSRRTMQLVNQFRREREGVFFCVMGGSVAEGIDFPGDELCFSIIVGIPYPPPTLESSAMGKMFDKRFGNGKGWEYVSAVPAQRKIRQAAGRMIRKETDRGMCVILDHRASRMAKELDAQPSDDPVADVKRFFKDF